MHFIYKYGLNDLFAGWLQMAQTPLHVSAGYNNVEIIKLLLDWAGPEKVELEAKNMVCKSYIFIVLV